MSPADLPPPRLPDPAVPSSSGGRFPRSPDDDEHRPATGTRAADLGGRRLIDLRPDDWLRFVTDRPEIRCLERLEGSLQWIGRETDVLLRVLDPEAGEFLVLIELQLRTDPRMAIRLEAYAALAEDKFGLPVYAVVVIMLPGGPEVTDHYASSVLGLEARRDIRVLRLWEHDAHEAVRAEPAGLLPLVPVMRGGADPSLLAEVLERLRQLPELAGMESLLAYFAGLVLGREAMLKLMRWDMETATRMTFYEEILNEGIERGIERGIEQGLDRGRHEAALRFVLHRLTHRFGPGAEALAPDLAQLDLDTLERLLDLVEEAGSLAGFRAALAGFDRC